MTTKEVKDMVAEVGIPTTYYQFPEGTNQPCPYICFYYPNRDDMKADNKNYTKITALNIELYTDEKDFELEGKLEGILEAHGIVYTKDETYLDSERMYMVAYTMEVII